MFSEKQMFHIIFIVSNSYAWTIYGATEARLLRLCHIVTLSTDNYDYLETILTICNGEYCFWRELELSVVLPCCTMFLHNIKIKKIFVAVIDFVVVSTNYCLGN